MSLSRKVTFLFFLLLALLVFCVYNNIKGYLDGTLPLPQEKTTQLKEPEQKQITPEIPLVTEETKTMQEPIIKQKNQVVEEEKSKIEKNPEEKTVVEELKDENKELSEDEALKIQETPIRIDTNYKRSNGELMYIDLSLNAQHVQDELYRIMKENPILFDKKAQKAQKGQQRTYELVSQILKDNPKFMIELAGHVFETNDNVYNTSLSVLRAANIKKIMKLYGVKNRIKARGYGNKIPLIQDEMKLTDRIEFNIIGEM